MKINIFPFLLILIRVLSMLLAIPLFEAKNILTGYKIILAVFISIILVHVLKFEAALIPADLPSLVVGICGEFLIGFVIGLMARLIFTAVEMAGEIAGFQMGFGIVNVVDPQTSIHVPIIGQFQTMLATLIFLTINADHYFIAAIAESFKIIPPMKASLSEGLIDSFIKFSSNMFFLAVKIGAPIIVALFITNIALSIISKTMPQMNILIVGFPLTIAGGLLIMSLSLPFFAYLIRKIFMGMDGDILEILTLMGR